ncbi:MAG: flagellar hook-basal body complex protein FliE [Lachnospiraceae bacterium]|nr:flagellar hook-basal body complex protein FliE [Lachnospiraceae bacterium]
MDVSSVGSLSDNIYKVTPSTPKNSNSVNGILDDDGQTFGDVLSGIMNVVDQTNALQVKAQNEEVKFALGEADNPHDLMIAQKKALTALQYTVAIRDRFLQGYQEIMNMQI